LHPPKEINGWEKMFFLISQVNPVCPSSTKKWMDQFCNGTRIATWFCDFIGPKYISWSCDNTRAIIYIFRPKEKVLITGECWTFTINYFPWAWMIPLSLTVIAYMSISWWLYNMLENYKLHHPCNDNTRTMQKQCFFFWRTNFKFALFFCVCMYCVC